MILTETVIKNESNLTERLDQTVDFQTVTHKQLTKSLTVLYFNKRC